MRLGQLARKLSLSPNTITEHLAGSGVVEDPNTKLEDDQVRALVLHFAPARIEEFFPVAAPEPAPIEPVAAAPEVVVAEEPVAETEATADEQLSTEPAEVIRAPKVELQGLKVIGKIELPQARKKADGDQPQEGDQQKPLTRTTRAQQNDRREQRQWKNPLEVKRQREEAEAERKRQMAAEQAKAKRTQNYLKRVKSVPTKAVKRVEEELVVETDIDTAPPPKSIWGKFVRWLRT